ncbi:hypothetical protein GN956_G13011 [Arapaima gigas]
MSLNVSQQAFGPADASFSLRLAGLGPFFSCLISMPAKAAGVKAIQSAVNTLTDCGRIRDLRDSTSSQWQIWKCDDSPSIHWQLKVVMKHRRSAAQETL